MPIESVKLSETVKYDFIVSIVNFVWTSIWYVSLDVVIVGATKSRKQI